MIRELNFKIATIGISFKLRRSHGLCVKMDQVIILSEIASVCKEMKMH